jgi:hypothetical protein
VRRQALVHQVVLRVGPPVVHQAVPLVVRVAPRVELLVVRALVQVPLEQVRVLLEQVLPQVRLAQPVLLLPELLLLLEQQLVLQLLQSLRSLRWPLQLLRQTRHQPRLILRLQCQLLIKFYDCRKARVKPGFFMKGIFVSILAVLVGCESASMKSVTNTVRFVVSDSRPQTLSDVKLAELGLGVIEVDIDARAPISMILGGIDPQNFTMAFYSEDRARLDILNGRVTRTRGFETDLLERTAIGADPFVIGLHQIEPIRTYFWKVSFSEGPRSVVGESQFVVGDGSTIELMGKQIAVRQAIEYWSIPDLSFSYENRYWFDQNGIVVKSEQKAGPDTPLFRLFMRSYQTQ